jgi:uncharacterized protein YqgC (DUF456 family)
MSTTTRVYDTYSHASRVVSDLQAAGIPTADISLVANKYVSKEYAEVEEVSSAGAGAGIGAALGGGVGLLAGLGLLAIPGLGPVVAAGWLASTAVGAAAGAATGGLIGALMGTGLSEEDAHVYAEAVRRGGTMVTVRIDDNRDKIVRDVMDRYEPINPVTRRAEYAGSGWTKFDPSAKPYSPSTAELERIRREYR